MPGIIFIYYRGINNYYDSYLYTVRTMTFESCRFDCFPLQTLQFNSNRRGNKTETAEPTLVLVQYYTVVDK